MNQNETKASHAEFILAKIDGGKSELKYQSGQVVYSQGDPAVFVFYVRDGRLKVSIVSEEGKEAVVAIHLPGNFFGEECLNGHPLRISTITAMEECLVTSIEKNAMLTELQREPKFSQMFMA